MNWDDKVCHAAQFVDHDPDMIGDAEYADGYVDGAVTGAKWQRDQLRTDEPVERMARALYDRSSEAKWSGMTWDDMPEDHREGIRKSARIAVDALLGEG